MVTRSLLNLAHIMEISHIGGKRITIVGSNPDDEAIIAATIINCNNGRGFSFNNLEEA